MPMNLTYLWEFFEDIFQCKSKLADSWSFTLHIIQDDRLRDSKCHILLLLSYYWLILQVGV